MFNVNDMYKEAQENHLLLLSSYNRPFWQEYIANAIKYDFIFRRMFKNFKYFNQEEDENLYDVTRNFILDVENHLLLNDKKYSELYRIHIIEDSAYSITDNYNMREVMDKDGNSNNSNSYGARTDTTNDTKGARSDTTSNSISARTDSNETTNQVSPYNSSGFYNDDKGNTIFQKGAETENSSFNKGAETDSSTIVKGAETDNLNNTYSEDYTLTRVGNIGVRTVTEMLDLHDKFWDKYKFYEMIFYNIAKDLLLV